MVDALSLDAVALTPRTLGLSGFLAATKKAPYLSKRAWMSRLETRRLSFSVSRDSCTVDVRPAVIRGAGLRTPRPAGGPTAPRAAFSGEVRHQRRAPSDGKLGVRVRDRAFFDEGTSGQRDVDLFGGGQVTAGSAQISAGGRGYVGVVTSGGDGQVIRAGAAAVARVECYGARGVGVGVGDDHFYPGVCAALAEQVPRDVAGRQPYCSAERDHDMRGVLADPVSAGERLGGGGGDRGHPVRVADRLMHVRAEPIGGG